MLEMEWSRWKHWIAKTFLEGEEEEGRRRGRGVELSIDDIHTRSPSMQWLGEREGKGQNCDLDGQICSQIL